MNTRFMMHDAFVYWVIVSEVIYGQAPRKDRSRVYLTGFDESGPQWSADQRKARCFFEFGTAARERQGIRGNPPAYDCSIKILRRTVRSKKGDGGP